MKILLTGGSGALGRELLKINPAIIAPGSVELDIRKPIFEQSYDIIIHAAAATDNRAVEKYPNFAIETNIIGTANIALFARRIGARLIYLSTDYIYPGDHGNYKEIDPVQPFNLYAWTKLGGECAVKAIENHLIIRTSFGKNEFPYNEAFTDKWSSKDYVDVLAPLIYEAALSPLTGVLNLGTERKTLYAHASERKQVRPIKIADSNYFTPYDTSLNLQKWQDYKASHAIAKPHTNCRVCGSDSLVKYLDLGLMPLANNLEFTAQGAKNKERFPLQVMQCLECGLSQLSVIIDPEKMFSYYTYRSGVNKGYIEHCKEIAKDLPLEPTDLHIDIAGNDGTLLKVFKEKYGHRVLNVDPASNLTAIAEADGIESVNDFWGVELAKTLGKAKLITATNVFAHLDDIHSFLEACKIALGEDGKLIIENPYLIDFIENNEFDTVYFEHVTYWSVAPLERACRVHALAIQSVKKYDIHGGTMQYTISHDLSADITKDPLYLKEAEFMAEPLQWDVRGMIENFSSKLLELKRKGYRIAAFAASAKGNTLLNASKMNTDIIAYIADETPEKIGKFSPGTGIPIVNKQEIIKNPPDYIVILSWNFKEEIMAKLKPIYHGRFIIPIPEFEII